VQELGGMQVDSRDGVVVVSRLEVDESLASQCSVA